MHEEKKKKKKKPGHLNSADYLSRSNPVSSYDHSMRMGEEYVNMVTKHSLPQSISIKRLKSETVSDKEMQNLQKCISGQFTNKGTLKEHFIIRNFLSSNNDLILYKHKIIIPKGLRDKIFELAHEGHHT